MWNQTAKTKGKTAKPLPIPGAKHKAANPAAHLRALTQSPIKAAGPVDQSPGDLDGDESAVSDTTPGGAPEQNENEGGPCVQNIEQMPTMADAVKAVRAKRKGPGKYDPASNTVRYK